MQTILHHAADAALPCAVCSKDKPIAELFPHADESGCPTDDYICVACIVQAQWTPNEDYYLMLAAEIAELCVHHEYDDLCPSMGLY